MIRQSVKAVRAWRPVNAPATAAARGLSRLGGREFEWAIKHLPRTGPVRSTLPNGEVLQLWSRGDDWISNQVFWRGWSAYEPETTPLFYELAVQADVVVDVGAYVGYYAVIAALANRRSKVFAFEPMHENAERARRHVSMNRLTNVELIEAAVADVEGSADLFHTADDHPSSTSLVRDFMTSYHHDVHSSRVDIVALDPFLEDRGVERVSLVKLDIETAEPEALRGMERTLRRDHPAILCEVLTDDVGLRVYEMLAPLGYRFYHLTGAGPVERPDIVSHPEWLNYLFKVAP